LIDERSCWAGRLCETGAPQATRNDALHSATWFGAAVVEQFEISSPAMLSVKCSRQRVQPGTTSFRSVAAAQQQSNTWPRWCLAGSHRETGSADKLFAGGTICSLENLKTVCSLDRMFDELSNSITCVNVDRAASAMDPRYTPSTFG
jgi:hypothetical protein